MAYMSDACTEGAKDPPLQHHTQKQVLAASPRTGYQDWVKSSWTPTVSALGEHSLQLTCLARLLSLDAAGGCLANILMVLLSLPCSRALPSTLGPQVYAPAGFPSGGYNTPKRQLLIHGSSELKDSTEP